MRILIADDHPAVRHGLREILADALSEAEFSEAENGDEVLSQLAGAEYSVLLLDINMPGRCGLDLLREARRNCPRMPVIMVSVQPEDQYAVACLQAGAAAYINKDSASEELAVAVKKVLEDGRYISPRLAQETIPPLDEPFGHLRKPS
jgi:DNA-binding NarL/FixJ family response regulator